MNTYDLYTKEQLISLCIEKDKKIKKLKQRLETFTLNKNQENLQDFELFHELEKAMRKKGYFI